MEEASRMKHSTGFNTISFAFCTNSTGVNLENMYRQFWRTRKPAGLMITNPLEMGKYFNTKKMIVHEQECHGKKSSFHFAKEPEVLR
ncbi:uncharacterized protein MONOS_18326 [Monocercomonoides exilis]|uniref:uncharacterized protein n=1 Tax=Monocercomonoides exilis TaxID=2049356 RepID=UPI00355A669D|nr:hypothetical protein MONOS_18326 [Monocercomonoides exilis]